MDLVSGFAVSNTGHRNAKVVQAIKDQADKYLHLTVYGEFIQSPQVKFASKLSSILPDSLNSVYYIDKIYFLEDFLCFFKFLVFVLRTIKSFSGGWEFEFFKSSKN